VKLIWRAGREDVQVKGLMGTSEFLSAPETKSMVTAPVAFVHSRVKGWPSTRVKSRLVKAGLAQTVATRAPTTAAIDSFIVRVGSGGLRGEARC
jgi:hypothetical protein